MAALEAEHREGKRQPAAPEGGAKKTAPRRSKKLPGVRRELEPASKKTTAKS